MMNNREPRTCGTCQYRHGQECRCAPPQIYDHVEDGEGVVHLLAEYPPVFKATPACGMWSYERRKKD